MLVGGGVMPKYFMDLKKCWGVENVCGYANKFCVWIKKKIGGGGGYAQIFY